MKKRIGVFVFYDKDGIVSDYVPYLLNDLKQNLDRLVVVCNGKLSAQGRDCLERYTSEIYVRDNIGYDAGAYKEAFDHFIGWDVLNDYDELVLCNDTFYGPLYPFEQVFRKMDSGNPELDFWGLTVHGKMEGSWWKDHNRYGFLPAHLQSFFLVVRSRLFHSAEFKRFWDEMDIDLDSVDDAIANFETSFTKVFEDEGFRWAPYCDTRELDDHKNQYIINQNVYNCAELIEKYGCPIIKRRAFIWGNHLEASDGGNAARAMEYIQTHTDYDTRLIFSHLLRVTDLSLLKRNLHWDYVLSKETSSLKFHPEKGTALVVFHMYYPDLVDTCLHYLMDLPDYVDVLVTTSNDALDKNKVIEKLSGIQGKFLGIIEAPKRGRDIAAFLVAARTTILTYQYACFTHDKKMSSEAHYPTIGENFRELIEENVLASGEYVANIIELFEENPCLGVAAPPAPFMGSYLNSVGNAWQGNFEIAQKLAKELNLSCMMSEESQPYILGTSLWFRTEALRPILEHDFKETDLPEEPLAPDGTISHAIERIFPFVAQSQGYYSAWIMTEEYASLHLEQINYMLSAILGEWGKRFPTYASFESFFNGFRTLLDDVSRPKSEAKQQSKVWGAKEAFLAWDPDLIRAAELAERHEEVGLNTIGFASAWSLFRISLSVWRKKHSPSKLNREMGEFMAKQKMPSVQQSWWLVRKTFGIWLKKII